MNLTIRPRRLRTTPVLRKMVRETRIDASTLIYPMFVIEGTDIREEIPSLPGQYRVSLDHLAEELESVVKAGVSAVMFFGIPAHKDAVGSGAWDEHGIVQEAFRLARKEFPDLYLIGDVCMCEYTDHGHCGILNDHTVDNDKTLKSLAKIAVSQVEAGADMVAPSDMMDGRVAAIRAALDEAGHIETPIMSYAVKYASSFYGPFREAAGEARKEAKLDLAEGADILMVKPAMSFLDIVSDVKALSDVPVAAYSVSGEYAMVKAAARNGWIDERRIIGEMAIGAYRAGADLYLTYYAKELAQMIREGEIG